MSHNRHYWEEYEQRIFENEEKRLVKRVAPMHFPKDDDNKKGDKQRDDRDTDSH